LRFKTDVRRRRIQDQVPGTMASAIPASSRFRSASSSSSSAGVVSSSSSSCMSRPCRSPHRTGFRATKHVGLDMFRGPRRHDHRGQMLSLTVSAPWPRAPSLGLDRYRFIQILPHGRSDRSEMWRRKVGMRCANGHAWRYGTRLCLRFDRNAL
jgi:hypothetical protein